MKADNIVPRARKTTYRAWRFGSRCYNNKGNNSYDPPALIVLRQLEGLA